MLTATLLMLTACRLAPFVPVSFGLDRHASDMCRRVLSPTYGRQHLKELWSDNSCSECVQVAITSRGRRADAFVQFLKPVLDRDNLTVVTRAQTKRIVMEQRDSTPTAVAVEVQSILVRSKCILLTSDAFAQYHFHLSAEKGSAFCCG